MSGLHAAQDDAVVSQGFKVLVLDDDLFFQSAIQRSVSLTIPGAETDVCMTVSEAKAHIDLAPKPYRLAMIDLSLPDGDGVEVIRYFLKKSPETMVLVLSVSADEEKVFSAVRAGATGYMVKGDIMLSVPKAIEQIVGGLCPISPSLAGFFWRLAGRETSVEPIEDFRPLTARELQVLKEFAKGKSYKQVADAMGISVLTVRTHTTNIYRKLGVKSSLGALSVARKHGLI